jgi:hypothetical protein
MAKSINHTQILLIMALINKKGKEIKLKPSIFGDLSLAFR